MQGSEGGQAILAARKIADHLEAQPDLRAAALKDGQQAAFQCIRVQALSDTDKADTFQLFRDNMEQMYRDSQKGWLEKVKEKNEEEK